jgi:photosystem II stability/assembly factor-like uncharacterized protein
VALAVAAAFGAQEPAGWKAAGWGGGGFYWACAFHPKKDGVIYLGGDVNGVYKSEDRGQHWRICNNGLSDYAIYSMAVDAKNPDTIYVGTPGGICKSLDAGEHWEFLEQTAPKALGIIADRSKSVRGLCVDAASGTVYAGTPSGKIFKSEDGGRAWKKLYELKAKGGVTSVSISASNPKLLVAATTVAGALKSDDGGESWVELSTPKNVSHVAIAASDPKIMYVAGKEGLAKSTDGGQTWSALKNGIDPKCAAIEVAIDATNPNLVYCVGNIGWNGTFYRSSDGGQTWTGTRALTTDLKVNPTLPEEWPGNGKASLSTTTNLAINPNNPKELFISANWRNVLSSDGGETWEERDAGADITCVSDIRFFEGKTYVTAMDEGLLVSPDNGASWQQLCPRKYANNLSGHQWRVHVSKKTDGAIKIVATSSPWGEQLNRVLISDDGGKTFKLVQEGLPPNRSYTNCMWGEGYARALAADPKDPNVLYLGIDGDPEPAKKRPGGGVFKSTDGGVNWKLLANQPASRRMFFGLAVDPTEPKRVFWGTCGNNGGLHRSEDGGETWTHVFKNESWVFNVEISGGGAIYCPGANLWRSGDHGNTWAKISNFDGGISIVGLEVHPKDEKTLWVSRVSWGTGHAGGIYKTIDGGKTWQDITADIPYRKPIVLRYNAETSELWAGGVGLYRIKQ